MTPPPTNSTQKVIVSPYNAVNVADNKATRCYLTQEAPIRAGTSNSGPLEKNTEAGPCPLTFHHHLYSLYIIFCVSTRATMRFIYLFMV